LEVSVLGDVPYNPPDEALEALARCLYPAIRSYFESEEGQREFNEWISSRRGTEPAEHSGADAA
jgi:hypothetical protein